MKKLAIILSFAGILFATSSRAEGLFIEGDLSEAKQLAKASGKLVMVDFKAEWCGPCKMLDRTTWSDGKVIESLKEKAVAVKIDVDEHGDLASKYRIRSLPTIMFLDEEGNEVYRFIGYRDARGFLNELGKVQKS